MAVAVNPLRDKINDVLNNKFYSDKEWIKVADFMAPLAESIDDKNLERKLKRKIENYATRLNEEFLKEFERVNVIVQKFDRIVHQMNKMCLNAYVKVEMVKQRSSDLLNKSNDLKIKRDNVQTRIDEFSKFLDSSSLTLEEEEELEKCEQSGKLSENFFKVLKHAEEIRTNCKLIVQEHGTVAAFEVLEEMQFVLDRGQSIILENIKREFKHLTIDSPRTDIIMKALFFLKTNDSVFQIILERLSLIRSKELLNTFMEATSAKSYLTGMEKVGSELTVLHDIVENEKELLLFLLDNDDELAMNTLNNNLCSLMSPLKISIENIISQHNEPIFLCQLLEMLHFYSNKFGGLIFKDNCISTVIGEIITITSQVFLAGVRHRVGCFTKSMTTPRDSLAPLPEIYSILNLFNELFSFSKTNEIFKEDHIYEITIDPLIQTIQLASTALKSDIEVAIFMINCLILIREAISSNKLRSSFFESRVEMISAMVEGNADVLVSMQVSEMVRRFGIGDLYEAIVRNDSRKPLSEIVTSEDVSQNLIAFSNEIVRFSEDCDYGILKCIEDSQERSAISKRNMSEFIKVYQIIVENIEKSENGYEDLQYLPVENVKKMLSFE